MARKKKSKTVDAVDPKACPNYDNAKESVAKHYHRLLPRCYTGAAKPAQVAATKEVNYLVLLGKIATTVLSDRQRRRFILHHPQQAPFEAAVMFDVADPAKVCPKGLSSAGAPMLVIRFVRHDPQGPPEAGQELVKTFYRHQRDGFINAEAAVVPLQESVVGMGAPTKEAVEYAIAQFEKCGALLTDSFKEPFEGSPLRPSFLAPPIFDFSTVKAGAHVQLKDMKTPGYDGLMGRVLGPACDPTTAELMKGRWAVMPLQAAHVATAIKLREANTGVAASTPLRPLGIKAESLEVVDEPPEGQEEGDIEEAD